MEGAECEANYCGGCNAEWFLIGDDITERCQEGKCVCVCGGGGRGVVALFQYGV